KHWNDTSNGKKMSKHSSGLILEKKTSLHCTQNSSGAMGEENLLAMHSKINSEEMVSSKKLQLQILRNKMALQNA
ncbi:hypothetical protein SERLA73DRAFT_148576, partial [Serpula lacrymans var. lacrymans S7.3]